MAGFFWSEFSNGKDNVPKQRETTWEQFVIEKMHFTETGDKKTSGLWSPTKYAPNATRGLRGVQSLSALVFDFDDKSDEFTEKLRASLTGIEHVFHTSFSHLQPGKQNRFRLIFPLAREANSKEWKVTRLATAKNFGFGIEDDRQTRHRATIFYWPACLPGAPRILEHVQGRRIEVEAADSALPEIDDSSKTAPSNVGVLRGTLGEHGNFLRRWASSEKESDAFSWYQVFLAGKPIAALGHRDDALQKAAWAIANRMTNDQLRMVDENVIVQFAAKSLNATPGPDDDRITADDFCEKLRRARRDVLFERTAGLQEEAEEKAFLAVLEKRAQPMPELSKTTNVSPLAPVKPWNDEEKKQISELFFSGKEIIPILNHGAQYILFSKSRGFSQRLHNDVVGNYAIAENLLEAGIEAIGSKKGELFVRSGKNLLDTYPSQSAIIAKVEGSFVGHSRFDNETKIFTEVVNPIRRLEPVFDQEIDDFLRAFCTHHRDYESLLAWLQRFPDLTKPSNVLFVHGPKNVGKSLLTKALARFWGYDAGTPPRAYFETFQDAFVLCPYVLADEGLPKEMVNSNKIREFATTYRHTVNRKNLPAVTWNGYARMAINGNDPDELKFNRDVLNRESIAAIEARFLRIEVNEAARAFIEEHGGLAWTTAFISGDKFIQHVEWLAANYQPKILSEDVRFPAMTDPANRMHDAARLDQDISESVCAMIWKCLAQSAGGASQQAWERGHICWHEFYGKRRLFVSAQLVSDPQLWQNSTEGQALPKPSPRKMGLALRLLSDPLIRTDVGGVRIEQKRMWPIDLNLLRHWAAESNVSEFEIKRLLRPPDPEVTTNTKAGVS